MLYQIVALLLDVATGLIGGACLLRLYMQAQRVPFGNPVGRLVFALSDWLVLPLRRILPAWGKWDTASLVAVWLLELIQVTALAILAGWGLGPMLPLAAVFGVIRLCLSGLMALVIISALLSWVRSDSSTADVLDRLCAPFLRPFRRLIPLVGGIDLSPLALLVALQIAGIVLASVQGSVMRAVG